jgi:hypothetical protein
LRRFLRPQEGAFKVKIKVTQEDIAMGSKNDCFYCPIALALKRHEFVRVHVGTDVFYADNHPYPLNKKAVKFIERFDSGKPVKPFSFEWKPR